MTLHPLTILFLGSTLMLGAGNSYSAETAAAVSKTSGLPANMSAFIRTMSDKHNFSKNELYRLFQSVELQPRIIEAITRPAEAMPWYKYRKIFMTEARIEGGVKFLKDNAAALSATEQKYGIPPEIIVAIIGVETSYGANKGSYRVIDALSTLAFNYPKRSPFFTSELENFLLLCREEKIDPLQPTGSYAGAMGIPQFMPSSFRAYAADFEEDQKRDIWNNPADAIASVGNYFFKHHWQRDQPVAFRASAQGNAYRQALQGDIKPDRTISQLKALQVKPQQTLTADIKAKLLTFELEQGQELWLGLDNFYVITRYNHSPLYAMAVYQLSRAIAEHPETPKISASLPDAPVAAPSLPESGPQAPIYIQLGAFGNEANAQALRKKIAEHSLLPLPKIKPVTQNGTTLHKVQIGPLKSAEDAERLNAKLNEIGIDQTRYIVESIGN
ncbi:lytic murein transglycosylase B [Methylotuvimicrobium alcaliphilum]|uniref:Membrane-bound lytic murein transglycosylase B (Modular protein) n=1 Tax=Methylotuvimicrobium alcaliphilum (strain DSM 19304 / NCIMB 14124 / VKM B-2133 / 20Z) TaxID=1091494 RepID=G4SUA2_META2|nr:lytic murein transglycosylase B [Methylotuvimicrobium alcaliphilum]CCE25051.1 Membrane-bound lytic murein transglycosylase B (modular protein) [Methylotuvimicrobium alcaliphilum 20Z]